MAILTRRKIDSTIEKRIVTGMIVSKKFLAEVNPIIDYNYFNSNHLKTLAKWSLEFYLGYEKAPSEHIQDLFNKQRAKIKEEEAEAIEQLLTELSHRYSFQEQINVDYLLDQTVEYFKKRELEITSGNMQVLLERNDVKGAEKELTRYKKLERLTATEVNPFDEQSVREVFEEDSLFFQMPGDLGKFLGPFDRHWFVGVTGPFKRGKTWILQEMAIEGILQRKSVAFFSLEMQAKQMNKRIYQRLTGTPKKEGGRYRIPCFDCLANQEGTCTKPERVNSTALLLKTGSKPEFSSSIKYHPCSVCKGTRDFQCEIWFKEVERPSFEIGYISNKIKAYQKKFGHLLRLIAYPRFSANTSDIARDLDRMESQSNFVPDIIIIDYADILKPEDGSATAGVEQVDFTWKCLAKLAGERHALVVTGAQATREALELEQVKQKHTSLWIGKLAHVDAMLSLNQKPEEKDMGIMRIGVMAHRHEDFNEDRYCTVLQNLHVGQTYLDSYWER